jgi:hypothetical protein
MSCFVEMATLVWPHNDCDDRGRRERSSIVKTAGRRLRLNRLFVDLCVPERTKERPKFSRLDSPSVIVIFFKPDFCSNWHI